MREKTGYAGDKMYERPIAHLNDARIFHLFNMFVVLRPFHRVESQLCVLIHDLERAGVGKRLDKVGNCR